MGKMEYIKIYSWNNKAKIATNGWSAGQRGLQTLVHGSPFAAFRILTYEASHQISGIPNQTAIIPRGPDGTCP